MEGDKVDKTVMNSFYLFGIGGLIAWNAILSDMDFFEDYLKGHNPSFIYPNMNFLLNVVFQFLLLCGVTKFLYKTQIIFSFTISIISLVSLPIVVKYIGGSSGFIFSCAIILFQGLANAVGLSSLYGIVSYLPVECIIAMSTGQGFAGILMNLVRYITLFSFFSGNSTDLEIKENKFYESLIFFCFSSLVCVSCLILVFFLYKNDYFYYKLQNSGEFINDQLGIKINSNLLEKNKTESLETVNRQSIKNKDEDNIFPYLWDLSSLIFVNYVVTFAVFPGAALSNQLFGLSDGFRINTLITIFNVFDSLGRYLPNFFSVNKSQLSFIVFLRCLFLFSFPILILIERDTNPGSYFGVIILIQMALLALSNGFNTSVAFSLAPKEVPQNLIGKSGSCMSFFLILGITTGTIFALLITSNILI